MQMIMINDVHHDRGDMIRTLCIFINMDFLLSPFSKITNTVLLTPVDVISLGTCRVVEAFYPSVQLSIYPYIYIFVLSSGH